MNNNYHNFVFLHANDKFEYVDCDNDSGYFLPQDDPYSKIYLKGNNWIYEYEDVEHIIGEDSEIGDDIRNFINDRLI